MAYHEMAKSLREVAEGGTIDELDSCAYEVLAALFSLVEPELHARLKAVYAHEHRKKAKDVIALRAPAQQAQSESDAQARLAATGEVLKKLGKSARQAADIQRREKLNVLWTNAVNGADEGFFEACCSLMAHLDIADMPGNQCIAVVKDAKRVLYVTGNGLWGSGEQVESTMEEAVETASTADEPWFTTGSALQAALDCVAGDIMAEYNLTRVLLINPAAGEFAGKFHAEMQLLEYMLDEDIYPERGYMGVSKPCCNFCRNTLDPLGIKYWNGHGVRGADPNDQVPTPYTSYKSKDKLMAYRANLLQVPFYGLIKNG